MNSSRAIGCGGRGAKRGRSRRGLLSEAASTRRATCSRVARQRQEAASERRRWARDRLTGWAALTFGDREGFCGRARATSPVSDLKREPFEAVKIAHVRSSRQRDAARRIWLLDRAAQESS